MFENKRKQLEDLVGKDMADAYLSDVFSTSFYFDTGYKQSEEKKEQYAVCDWCNATKKENELCEYCGRP